MPVYLDTFSLILDKKAIIEKYSGGIEQFRIDYNIPESQVNQEDDELFALGKMNGDEFDIDKLVAKGLSFDEINQKSNDFTIIYRYGDLYWEVNWLKHNKVFAWHIKTDPRLIAKVDEISALSISEIQNQMKKGIDLLWTIRG